MNFQELCDEVKSITRRPDLSARIESAVKASTLKAHQSDFYYPDIIEAAVEFTNESHIQNFNAYEIVPRFRKAKYLRQWFGEVGGDPGKFYEHIQIEEAFDGYGYIKQDVFYFAGQNLQIRSRIPVKRVLFGCYVHPSLDTNNFTSWIAKEVPFAIIYDACRTLFKSIALDAEARDYDNLTSEQYASLKMSYIDDAPWT